MRKRRSKDGLTVNAVAGAHVVLLGWTIGDANRPNGGAVATEPKVRFKPKRPWFAGER